MTAWHSVLVWGLAACLVAGEAVAQDAGAARPDEADTAPQPAEPEEELIQFNLPENTSLKVLVDFVGEKLKLNIVYDAMLNGRTVTIKAPNALPAKSLRQLLESMLRINGMVMVETDVKDVLRITQNTKLAEVAVGPLQEGDPIPEGRAGQVVSRIFKLEHVTPERIRTVVGPFTTASAGATVIELPEYDMVIITDYAANMPRINRLVELADQPGRPVLTSLIPVEHLSAEEVGAQLKKMIEARGKVRGQADLVEIVANARTNQLFIISEPDQLKSVEDLVASIDVSLGLVTEVYRLNVVTPSHLDDVAREIVGEEKVSRLYKSVADEETNLLAVTTTEAIHEQVRELIATMDVPVPETASPIRFYKLQNANALQVSDTLNGIAGEGGLGSVTFEGFEPVSATPAELPSDSAPTRRASSSGGTLPDARVLADVDTNTIIVIAPPGLQPIYENLIKRLDARRPQVRIEATIVALDTTDDFSLGVEFSRSDSVDGGSLLNFSQFGLSTADPATGALTLNPGLGFNGALLSADIAEVVIQALQSDTRSRVVTRPSVLVNDNAEGTLESVDTEPFESVNANNQVATTSYGGDLEAGTSIKVKPSISDGDFLKLEYSIQISSFVGDRTVTSTGGTLPPARSENTVSSSVTIPDGHTIVVGGLSREIDSETIERIPILGEIPIVEYAFSNRNETKRQITLFLFLRAYVLRDDKFEDLKVMSGAAAGRAKLPSPYPTSLPVEIR
ncbi:MAG: secretin N-terminal domain-containing protein [Phycisphaeraceae bacterium]